MKKVVYLLEDARLEVQVLYKKHRVARDWSVLNIASSIADFVDNGFLIKAFCSFVLLSDWEFLQDRLCNVDELLEHLKHPKSQPETQSATHLVDKVFLCLVKIVH